VIKNQYDVLGLPRWSTVSDTDPLYQSKLEIALLKVSQILVKAAAYKFIQQTNYYDVDISLKKKEEELNIPNQSISHSTY